MLGLTKDLYIVSKRFLERIKESLFFIPIILFAFVNFVVYMFIKIKFGI